jgi:hypothetical protein
LGFSPHRLEPRQFERQKGIAVAPLEERRRALIAQNRDNVVFETGTMKLKGNELIRAGRFVKLTRGVKRAAGGGLSAEYITPGASSTTSCRSAATQPPSRSTAAASSPGAQREGGVASPYFAEINARGVL